MRRTDHIRHTKTRFFLSSARAISFALVAAMLSAVFSANAALAKEVCVICEQPKMNYRCRIPDIAIGRATDTAANYICIAAMAKSGGHSKCKVDRNPYGFSCMGKLRILNPQGKILNSEGNEVSRDDPNASGNSAAPDPDVGNNNPSTTGNVADDAEAPQEPDKKVSQPGVNSPPKTVEELARNTAEQSSEGLKKAGEQIENAGSAISNAAKKAWECIASFFLDC